MSESLPLERRRGMDARWWEERGDWTAVQVLAPCLPTAEALSRTSDMQRIVLDALDPQTRIADDDWTRAVFVFQLRGHAWTLVDSLANAIMGDVAEALSKKLSTQALIHMYGNTAGVYGYYLYERGREIEAFSRGYTPAFDDSNREEHLAEGWRLSDDNGRQFRSRRKKDIDMNSDEVFELPDLTARELDLYIPCDVWDIDSDTGKVMLQEGWSPDDFQDARLVLSKW